MKMAAEQGAAPHRTGGDRLKDDQKYDLELNWSIYWINPSNFLVIPHDCRGEYERI